MSAQLSLRLNSRIFPPQPRGTASMLEVSHNASYEVVATGNTIAQITLLPEDFAGGGSLPLAVLNLDNGTDPDVQITTTPGGGSDIAVRVSERLIGENNDFDRVRFLQVEALAQITGASALEATVQMGDLSGAAFGRLCLPIGWDSADTTNPAASAALVMVPLGIIHASAHTLQVSIHKAVNAMLVISLLGN